MNDIQNPGQALVAFGAFVICGITGMIASILDHIEFYVRIGSGCMAMISCVFAVNYYVQAVKKMKRENKLLKQQLNNQKSTIP